MLVYWQQGYSTEHDFIYATTANLSHEQLQQLSDEVGPDRSLLVLCTAFRGRGGYLNLTVKKIPRQVLSRCEWGHDDYSLRVENLPKAPAVSEPPSPRPSPARGETHAAPALPACAPEPRGLVIPAKAGIQAVRARIGMALRTGCPPSRA